MKAIAFTARVLTFALALVLLDFTSKWFDRALSDGGGNILQWLYWVAMGAGAFALLRFTLGDD